MNALCLAVLVTLPTPQTVLGRVVGETPSGFFGNDVKLAPDLDGDGIDELLVTETRGGQGQQGVAHIFSGATLTRLRVFFGESPNDLVTESAWIEDMDGDGVGEWLVGAPGSSEFWTGGGRVRAFSGALGSMESGAIWFRDGWGRSQELGSRCRALGDLDGDGVNDFGVSAPRYPNYAPTEKGRLALYSGGSGNEIRLHDGEHAEDRFGTEFVPTPDVDGDGTGEILVSAPHVKVYLLSGKTGATLRTWKSGKNQYSGDGLAVIGDVDGDGVAEVAIGSIGANGLLGAVRLHPLSGGPPIQEVQGDYVNAWFGYEVAALGDVNRDGVPDYGVGAYLHGGAGSLAGKMTIYSGADGSLLASMVPESDRHAYGWSISTAGDPNQDGYPDIAMGSIISAERGMVTIFSGDDLFLDAEVQDDGSGRELTLTTRGGPPFAAAWVELVEFVGGPPSGPGFVVRGHLDAQGTWSRSIELSPTLWGYEARFQSFAVPPQTGRTWPARAPDGDVMDSGVVRVTLSP